MKAPRFLLSLAFAAALCPRGGAAGPQARLGTEALAEGLWEVAAAHFEKTLEDPALAPAERAGILLKLAETRVRAGQTAEALELLGSSLLAENPEADFWRALATAAAGRFGEAVESLGKLLDRDDFPHRVEAAFTLANLQLALDRPDDALATLAETETATSAATATEARLRGVAILLDLGRRADARQALPKFAEQSSPTPFATLLEARLLAAEGNHEAAAALYQSLLDQPAGQSLPHYHMAALGKAETRAALIDPAAGINELLSFLTITKEKDWPQPLLPAMFGRIIEWLPAQPAPNDPLFARLGEWIPPFVAPSTGLIASYDHGVLGAWPSEFRGGELAAHSMFAMAIALSRTGLETDRGAAGILLERLRLNFPSHPLAARALYQQASMDLEAGNPRQASYKLDALQEYAALPELRGRAAFLQGADAFRRGDFEAAGPLFAEAAKDLAPQQASIALFNSAIASFELGNSPALPIVTEPGVPPALAADLELERALAVADPAGCRAALEAFLGSHPSHPRVAEARLAAAETALAGPKPDVSFATAQLDTIAENPAAEENLPAGRVDWVRLRIADLAHDHETVVNLARQILSREPAPPEAPEAAFILGRNLFESGRYNDAHLALKQLAESSPDPARAQAASLLAASAAALVGTPQSRQEALVLYDRAIAAEGPASPIARLEKARLMIDMNRLPEAIDFLREWFGGLKPEDPLHLPAGLLLGEAIYARGGASGDSLDEALAVYDQLLGHAKEQPSLFPRLQYLRGQALEQIADPDDPAKKRERDAFTAYYSVLEAEAPPAEWHYFELCGFKALSLLEKAGRWPAAIACARKIASFNGPRAEEAAKRANDLQLKHMIWED